MYERHISHFSRIAFAAIETLEQRRLLSTVSLVNNPDMSTTLRITGTNSKDTVTIYDDPANNSVEVVDDKNHNGIEDPGEVHTFTNANLHNVNADMKKGDDTVEIEPVSTYDGQQRSFDIDLKEGNDHFTFVSPTLPEDGTTGAQQVEPNGADITDRSDISFTVEGESGNDHLRFDLSRTSIDTSAVSINADTESGNDTVDLLLPDATFGERGIVSSSSGAPEPVALDSIVGGIPGELQAQIDLGSGKDTMNLTTLTGIQGSIANINVLGDSGNDTFNDHEDFGVFNGGSLTVNSNLGSGDDRYHGLFAIGNGRLPTMVTEPLGSLQSAPTIEIGTESSASFNIQGSTGNDKLEFDDTNIPNVFSTQPIFGPVPLLFAPIEGLLDMEAHGGANNDLCEIDLDPSAVVSVGTQGTFRGIVSGDDGKDHCRLDVLASGGTEPAVAEGNIATILAGQFDLSVLGGGDNDTIGASFELVPDAENTPDHYGPRGAILVDGGRGTDKYDTEGNGIFNLRGLETLDESLENPFF